MSGDHNANQKHQHFQLRSVMRTAESWQRKAGELESDLDILKARFLLVVQAANNLANNAHEQLVSGDNQENLRLCVDEWETLIDAIRDLNK